MPDKGGVKLYLLCVHVLIASFLTRQCFFVEIRPAVLHTISIVSDYREDDTRDFVTVDHFVYCTVFPQWKVQRNRLTRGVQRIRPYLGPIHNSQQVSRISQRCQAYMFLCSK
jgi:hypothetical protein